MATTINTGRDLSLTINSVQYDAQASSVTLTESYDRQEYETLDGTVYKTINQTADLNVEMFADWGAAGSICEAVVTAAKSSPDTAIGTFSFTTAAGAVFSGSVLPPSDLEFGGSTPEAQMVNWTFRVVGGNVTRTFS